MTGPSETLKNQSPIVQQFKKHVSFVVFRGLRVSLRFPCFANGIDHIVASFFELGSLLFVFGAGNS